MESGSKYPILKKEKFLDLGVYGEYPCAGNKWTKSGKYGGFAEYFVTYVPQIQELAEMKIEKSAFWKFPYPAPEGGVSGKDVRK